jgi:hypothetical protein
MNLFEARELARECMYDDQLAAVEAVARAILANPDDPGLPTVEPPAEGQNPQTGVHAHGSTEQGEDPRLHRDFGTTPGLAESLREADRLRETEAPSIPEILDYERGWRAGRGAAVRAVEDLRSRTIMRTPEEVALTDALHCVASLEVKGEP